MPERVAAITLLITTISPVLPLLPKTSLWNRIFQPNADDGTQKNTKGVWGIFYIDGNYFDNTCPQIQNHKKKDKLLGLIADANADNWEGIHPNTKNADLPDGSKESIKK